MPHMYGVDENGAKWLAKASGLKEEVLAANAADVDAKARFPQEAMRALAATGFYGMCAPASVGGGGQGFRTYVAVVEELAQGCPSTAIIYTMHVMAQQAIGVSTTLKDKAAVLTDICAGKHLTQLAFSEKGSRAHFYAPVSQLKAADGGFTVNADKSFVTAAHHAQSFVALSQMPNAKSHLESTLYLVRLPNKSVRPVDAWTGHGLRGNDSVPVVFEGLSLSAGDLITPHGEGFKTVMEVVLPWFCTGTAAVFLGTALAAFGNAAKHVQETGYQGGSPPGALGAQKLRDLPNLRNRLAQMLTRTSQARALLGYALGELEHPSEMTPLWLMQARAAAMEAAWDVADLAMKTVGGTAFARGGGMERIYRDSRASWLMSPTPDQLYELAGRALTGLPLF